MRSSNTVSAAFLGVFGAVCFIGGFFTGEYATYNKQVIADIFQKTNSHVARLQEVLDYGFENYRLNQLIELRKTSSLDEYIHFKLKHLAKEIEEWENKLNDNEYMPFSKQINFEIERAKEILDSANNS